MQSLHYFLQKYFNVLLALALLNQLTYEPAGPVQIDRKLIFKKDDGPEKTESGTFSLVSQKRAYK